MNDATHRLDTHLCLVSEQAVPNLLPLFDERWRPRRVVLAVSKAMTRQAECLETVVRRRCPGISIERLELGDAYDYDKLSNDFLDFLSGQAGIDVALNVTGGTKMMAVAAQEAFRSDGRPVFYVNVATDEVVRIGQTGHSEPLQAEMKVQDLLDSHGYAVESPQRPQVTAGDRDLCARLIDHVKADGIGLGLLNRLAASDEARQRLQVLLSDQDRDSQSLGRVIDLFCDAGHLRRDRQRLVFPDDASRQFANGGWLELHVYQVLNDLRGEKAGITDVAMGVGIRHPDGRTRNELDVACLLRNTLHIVECKTANLGQAGASGDDKATEAIYKVEALSKIGGLRTKAMIVDFRGALSSSKANRDRAKGAGIAIAAADQLRDLKGLIGRVWLAGRAG
ncbi:MAG: DUF1887 family protein [Burkholderiales bacterium]|nr:DUF1887 family protein [Burkholderiales bacterium]